jgi:hypothetical protein
MLVEAADPVFEDRVHEGLFGAHAVIVTLPGEILLGERQIRAQILQQRRHQDEVAA